MVNQIKLDVGTKLGISCPDIGIVFDCIVIRAVERSIVVCSASTAKLPVWDSGTILRINNSGKILRGVVLSSSSEKWEIGDLECWDGKERREFFRQRLSAKAEFVRLAKDDTPELRVEGTILDISASGLRFSCSENYWGPGDRVSCSWTQGTPTGEPFTFLLEVVRTNKTYAGNFYGCRFIDLPERDRDSLLKAIFYLQVMERRRRR